MTIPHQIDIKLDYHFDREQCRHLLDDEVYVLHCHHYATLYAQLADDCGMLDGRKLLAEVAEDAFYDELDRYCRQHGIAAAEDRIQVAEQYYAQVGLGRMNVLHASEESGEIELARSHIDQGWIKKWGKRDKPVNFVTLGYIAAMMSVVFDNPRRSYVVAEIESIVRGDERSFFRAVYDAPGGDES